MLRRKRTKCDRSRGGPSATELAASPARFQFARALIIVCFVALIVSLGCSSSHIVHVRDILAHPNAYADTVITIRGSISRDGASVPFTNVVVRKFTDAVSDTISIITVPDTLTGKTVRISGVVHVLDFGFARIGPVIVVGHLRAALPAAGELSR